MIRRLTMEERKAVSNSTFVEEKGGIAKIQKYIYYNYGEEIPVWVDLDNKHPDPSRLLIWGWDSEGNNIEGDFKNKFTPTREKYEIPWSVKAKYSTAAQEKRAKVEAIEKFIKKLSARTEDKVIYRGKVYVSK